MPWEEETPQGQEQDPAAGGQEEGAGNEGQQQQPQETGQEQDQEQQGDVARAFKAMRDEMKELKDAKTQLEQRLNLYEANMPRQEQSKPEPPPDPWEGFDEDDVLDIKTAKNIFQQQQQMTAQQLREVQLRAQFPDIEQTISTYLPNALSDDPGLQQALRQSGDPYLAYQIAKREKALQEASQAQQPGGGGQQAENSGQQITDRIIDNLSKPQSPGTVGGGGSGVDRADRYLNMSEEEFEAYREKIKAQG